jgi:SAM-dependent methyltransferase
MIGWFRFKGEIVPTHAFEQDLLNIQKHYSKLVHKYGDSAPGVQWRDRETQERRLEILTEVGDVRFAKVLDFGCGVGHLLSFMRNQFGFKGEYIGYDLSAAMIAAAINKFPDAKFEQRDVLAEGLSEDFDYILISGVFNNRVSDGWGLMTKLLSTLFPHARKAMAFNALSSYVDYCDSELFYVEPERVFHFCKEHLSPCVSLRHDYLIKAGVVPFEFSVYIYQSGLQPRKC